MYQYDFSEDIWDYLGDMPEMPSRKDRDILLQAARNDSRQAKRVHIWDYFFTINPAYVGLPQQQEIDRLQKQKNLVEVTVNTRFWFNIFLCMATFCVLIGLLGAQVLISHILILTACLVIAGDVSWYSRKRIRLEYELQVVVSQLDKEITELKRLIPAPPSDQQIRDWLQEDIDELTQTAEEQTGLETRLVQLRETNNPLCIRGPAMLQNIKTIPQVFLNQGDDRWNHLLAYKFAMLPDGTFQDFYGVYYVEFILVANDMLGSYGCFFDLITGRTIGEHTSEQYYRDVVMLNIRHEYREVELGTNRIIIENAPTFGMSLTSGERVDVTFPNLEYFTKISEPHDNKPISFDPKQWASNPEIAADNAIKALRSHLRKHKGLIEAVAE